VNILKWQFILVEGGITMKNKNLTREEIEKQDQKNDVELSGEYTIGNTNSQSQKKSGRQNNKK
jgi:hypothetical protein